MDGLVSSIRGTAREAMISTFPRRRYSAEFYTQGSAITLESIEELTALTTNGQRDAVIVANSSLDTAKAALGEGFKELRNYRGHTVLLEAEK